MSLFLQNQTLDPIAALRLSIACKNRQKDYYETFKITNDVRNKGDITYFVLQFLDILKTGLEDYLDDFTNKVNQYHYYQKKQSQLDLNHSSRTILETVIDYSLFYLEPITLTKLVELTHLSKSTISNHLNKLEKDGLVEKSKPGKNCLFHFKKMHNKMNPPTNAGIHFIICIQLKTTISLFNSTIPSFILMKSSRIPCSLRIWLSKSFPFNISIFSENQQPSLIKHNS